MNIEKAMTPRLLAICSCVAPGGRLADVGTDHAYVPIYLVQRRAVRGAIAMDIRQGPLARAEENIRRYKMEDKISTRLSDGLRELAPGEADELVIAGMGGILICDIMEARRDLWTDGTAFILQPMTASEEVRRFLVQNGFRIEKETLAREDNKLYQMIRAVRGDSPAPREIDYYIGPYLREHHVPLTAELVDRRIAEFEKILRGLSRSGRPEMEEKRLYAANMLDEMYAVREECAKW